MSEGQSQQAQQEFAKAQSDVFLATAEAANRQDWDTVRALQEQILTFGNISPLLDANARVQIGHTFLSQDKPALAREKFESFLQKSYPSLSTEQEAGIRTLKQTVMVAVAKSYIQEGNLSEGRAVLQELLNQENLNSNIATSARKLLATLPPSQK